MSAVVIDGKKIASEIQADIAKQIKELKISPKLDVILVGDDPASLIYIKKKQEMCALLGIRSLVHHFSSQTSEEELLDFIRNTGDSDAVDAILVQLPLPEHIDKYKVFNTIPPHKDVDCFNASNIGYLAQGKALLKPCTPSGICEIFKYHNIATEGRRVTIINRSQVVGQPLSLMLSQHPYNATVTVCHEHTENLKDHVFNSDIVVSAVGRYPTFQLHPAWIKPGSVVIDVAVNRRDNVVFGDLTSSSFAAVKQLASYISGIPGGVGPLTVAMLMKNTLVAAKNKTLSKESNEINF